MRFQPAMSPQRRESAVSRPIREPGRESPMKGYVRAAIRCTVGGPRKMDKSDIRNAVVSGERHAALALDRILLRACRGGATIHWGLNVVRAVRQSVLTIWGGLPDVTNPMRAHLAETMAECDSNKLQAEVFADLPNADPVKVDALMVALELESAHTEGLLLTLGVWKLTKESERRAARRQVGLA